MNQYRKFLVSLLGALAAIVTLGVLHGTAQVVATAVITVASALGVAAAPNDAKASPIP